MSTTTVIAVYPGEKIECVSELQNSFGSAPYVWDAMAKRYIPGALIFFTVADRLWPLYKRVDIPFHQRAVLMMTYDRAYISKPNYLRAAADIRAFLRDFPPDQTHVCHWQTIAKLFDSDPDYPGIGFWMTSVTGNPFNGEWNDEKEAYDDPNWSEVYDLYAELDALEAAR